MIPTTAIPRVPGFVSLLNPVIARLLRMGLPMGPNVLLSVRGRWTGRPRTTPVALVESDGRRWLLATYGAVHWVRNLRAAGEGIVIRGRRRSSIVAEELTVEARVAFLERVLLPYLAARPLAASFLRPYLELPAHATPDDVMRAATRHPVFEVTQAPDR